MGFIMSFYTSLYILCVFHPPPSLSSLTPSFVDPLPPGSIFMLHYFRNFPQGVEQASVHPRQGTKIDQRKESTQVLCGEPIS